MGSTLSLLSWNSNYVPKIFLASTDGHSGDQQPARFTIHDKAGVQRLTLSTLLQEYCPSLYNEYRPAWWLHSGHLQTGYCVMGDFSKVDEVVYERKLLRLVDGGTLGLDFTPRSAERDLPGDTPIVVVMHGLTGGSHESYVRAILASAVRPKQEGGLGYRGIVVNFRGCAGVPLTSGQLYSAGHTDDLRQALMYISNMFPDAPLLGIGFSLGANVIVRYLAEEGVHSRLRAGCALGCPWDLLSNSNRIESEFFLRHVYSRGMGGNLVNLMKQNANWVQKIPDNPMTPIMMELFSIKSPKLIDVDSRLTSVVGGSSPPFPFATARDYYIWASSHRCLGDIRVPLLAVNAGDDPIVRHLPLNVGSNQYVALAVSANGGHLGWFESGDKWGEVRRWITRPALEWLKVMGQNYVPNATPPLKSEVVDGWTREVERSNLGYRELGDFGEVVGVAGETGFIQGL